MQELAAKLAQIPLTQLIAMKLIVNQAYGNMGLQSTQTLGPILDGIMRNTPEGREFVRVAKDEGVKAAVTMRDARCAIQRLQPRAEGPAAAQEKRTRSVDCALPWSRRGPHQMRRASPPEPWTPCTLSKLIRTYFKE